MGANVKPRTIPPRTIAMTTVKMDLSLPAPRLLAVSMYWGPAYIRLNHCMSTTSGKKQRI